MRSSRRKGRSGLATAAAGSVLELFAANATHLNSATVKRIPLRGTYELDVPRHNRHTVGVQRRKIGILEQVGEVTLGRLLKSGNIEGIQNKNMGLNISLVRLPLSIKRCLT